MKLVVLSVKDVRLGEFLPPFVAPNLAVGERMFGDACNEDSPFRRNPDDFVLHVLCEFEAETGQFSNAEMFSVLKAARSLIKEK